MHEGRNCLKSESHALMKSIDPRHQHHSQVSKEG